MGMTSQSGSSQTTSTQPYIMSGPSLQAAQGAAAAQIQAAQMAAGAVTQDTQSAISALMNQYSTALEYANPTINTGNQAAAQMNYMLGLPAVNPGAAPTTVNLASEEAKVTPAQLQQYIDQNSGPVANTNPAGGAYGNGTSYYWQYQGNGSTDPTLINEYQQAWNQNLAEGKGVGGVIGGNNPTNDPYAGGVTGGLISGLVSPEGNPTNGYSTTTPGDSNAYQAFSNNPTIMQDATQAVAQQNLTTDLPAYQQQMAQYNQQENLYNQYSAMGQATPGTINSIISNQPGFQFAQNQGINAIQNAGSASGMLNSGNILQQLNQFGQGISEQYYNNYMNQLGSLAGLGQQATGQAMSGATNLGNSIAGADTTQGTAQANADLAAGQAMASSYLTPVANQQVNMTPYTTTSNTNSSSSGFSGSGLLSSLMSL